MHSKQSTLLFFLLFSLILLFQGCAPTVKQAPDKSIELAELALQQEIDALLTSGDYETAAIKLESKARISQSPQKEHLLLQAGEVWSQAGEWAQVERLLSVLTTTSIPDDLRNRQRMLQVEFAISQQNLNRALELMQPPVPMDGPLDLRQRYHRNMAEIYRLNGNLLESARELVDLDKLLTDSPLQLENQQKLVMTLSSLTDTALALLQPEPPGMLGAWMDLVRIFKRGASDPANFDAQFEAWREAFPEHPALPELLTEYAEQRTLDRSHHIAILLPYSGPYAKVAASLRDGFMAAWYQRSVDQRPVLRFYDSSEPERILELYQRAVLQGAQLIVGPLDKQAVQQLVESPELQVPVLALNQVEESSLRNSNLIQFGLAPEDEAEQIAERAWLDGHTSALALTPRNDWGNRLYLSFRERWTALGGSMLEHQTYNSGENDFSRPIRLLLNIDESEARKNSLQNIIGVPMESEARRRGDAGFIFLVARSQKGRQVRPQLRFHHAGSLPVYTTSHIYNGIGDVDKDKDLGRIKFVDTPWILEKDEQNPLARDQLEKLIPEVRSDYARFYAMGIDAFNLLPHLQVITGRAGHVMQGTTGNLYLDENNRIHRQLAWIDMDHGQAEITGSAPKLEKPASPYQISESPGFQPHSGVVTDPKSVDRLVPETGR